MYHYDMPQYLQDIGGFTNPLFVNYFEVFARVLYKNFGSRVKLWITFNEPFDTCVDGYGTGISAPLISVSGVGEYLCGHYLLEAHAVAYHLYKDKYYEDFKGLVGISLNSRYYYPKDSSVGKDVIQRAMEYRVRQQIIVIILVLFMYFISAWLVRKSNIWQRWWVSKNNDSRNCKK